MRSELPLRRTPVPCFVNLIHMILASVPVVEYTHFDLGLGKNYERYDGRGIVSY